MFPRIVLFLALKLLVFTHCWAIQNDSIQHWRVHVDNRFCQYQKESVSILGVTGGYSWGRTENEVTVGYYWLTNSGRQALTWATRDALKKTVRNYRPQLDQFNFVSVGYWHHFYDSRRIRLGIPVELGYGKGLFRNHNGLQFVETHPTWRQSVFPIHVAGYGEWKTTKWIGTGFQVGYRHYVNGQEPFTGMHGLFYRVRVLGYIALFKDWQAHLFKKKKLNSPFF